MANVADTVLRKALGMLSAINEWISMTARNSAGMLLIAMTAIVLVQIEFRYVLNDSLNLLVIWIIVVFWSETFGMVDRGFSIRAASFERPELA